MAGLVLLSQAGTCKPNKAGCHKMKTYNTSISPSIHNLYLLLEKQLPAKFSDKIKGAGNLLIAEKGNSIEIGLPAPYESYLYKIEVINRAVNISKSEHYTDDVNSLALEDILTDIVMASIGRSNIDGIEPSSN
jgi:hypothetical protein